MQKIKKFILTIWLMLVFNIFRVCESACTGAGCLTCAPTDSAFCLTCDDGYYLDIAVCKTCVSKYTSFCATCDIYTCKTCIVGGVFDSSSKLILIILSSPSLCHLHYYY